MLISRPSQQVLFASCNLEIIANFRGCPARTGPVSSLGPRAPTHRCTGTQYSLTPFVAVSSQSRQRLSAAAYILFHRPSSQRAFAFVRHVEKTLPDSVGAHSNPFQSRVSVPWQVAADDLESARLQAALWRHLDPNKACSVVGGVKLISKRSMQRWVIRI